MQEYRNYIIVLSLFLLFIVGTGTLCVLFRSCGLDSKNSPSEMGIPATRSATGTSGTPTILPSGVVDITPTGGGSSLLSAGTGTTTMSVRSPYNDILIAETGSEYATLRNARYTTWPYPGEVRFKEVYLVLPDEYDPVFPGYSNNQFVVSSDGTKQVKLYLRHKQSTSVGADAEVYIQSPIETDEADHPMMLIESSGAGAVYSLVRKGEEVLVEVSYKREATPSIASARAALLRAIEAMELVW